jgi:hypothetical protein
MIALSAVYCNALCLRCDAVHRRSDPLIPKRHTACVCSFEIRFDGPVCLQYFAVLQHFSSIRTRLNNRRLTSLSSTPRKRSVGRMQQWVNDRVRVGTMRSTRDSQLRKKGGLGATALVHQSALAGCARRGDRATSGSPSAAREARSRSSRLKSRWQFTTKGRVVRSRRSEFPKKNSDFSQFAVPAE